MKDLMSDCDDETRYHLVACSAAGRLGAEIIAPAPPAAPAPPLLVLHGIARNADALARLFAPEAARRGRMLIVPHFSERGWPVFQRPAKAARPDQALLALLDKAAQLVPGCDGQVEIFGHSGGAQLAHRFAMLYPHRVAGLHLAAAGWYCLPDASMSYPYGLAAGSDALSAKWARRKADALSGFLGLPTAVYVGTEDTSRDPALRVSEALDAGQGPHRNARARLYVAARNAAARAHGMAASTRLIEMPGCDHDVVRAIVQNGLAAQVLATQARLH